MRIATCAQYALLGIAAASAIGARFHADEQRDGPVLTAAVTAFAGNAAPEPKASSTVTSLAQSAVETLGYSVTHLSSPSALHSAFTSYFAYKALHPADVQKPYLYFVDYGLPSTAPRGYLFDMSTLTIVDGPFTVAHGRGSSTSQYGVPSQFSNASNSSATSLGLYVARALYSFHGHAGGQAYSSVGLRLDGVSAGFNDNALSRGVVAHGAPYVTSTEAGRSQGCPAMEPQRAERLLPELANGGMVFLYAPDQNWLNGDPWLSSAGV